MSPGCCGELLQLLVSTGSGLQLGWEGEPDRADAGAGERAPDHQEWGPPGSPGQLQNGDQALDVSQNALLPALPGPAGAQGAAGGCWGGPGRLSSLMECSEASSCIVLPGKNTQSSKDCRKVWLKNQKMEAGGCSQSAVVIGGQGMHSSGHRLVEFISTFNPN